MKFLFFLQREMKLLLIYHEERKTIVCIFATKNKEMKCSEKHNYYS